jgi:hypothetical protein
MRLFLANADERLELLGHLRVNGCVAYVLADLETIEGLLPRAGTRRRSDYIARRRLTRPTHARQARVSERLLRDVRSKREQRVLSAKTERRR